MATADQHKSLLLTWDRLTTAARRRADRANHGGLRFTAYPDGLLVVVREFDGLLIYEAACATQAAARSIADEFADGAPWTTRLH